MFAVKSAEEFIDSIRALDGKLKNIKLKSIEVSKQDSSVVYNFICDETVDEQLKGRILDTLDKNTLKAFSSIKVNIKKIVSNDELINNSVYKYISDNYPSISIFLKSTDIICTEVGEVVKYTVRLGKEGADYVRKNGALKKINEYLEKNFCSEFVGNVEIKSEEETVSLISEEVYESELQKIEHRTIKVKNVEPIDDPSMGDVALYIEDAVSGEVTVCGSITDITERTTKNQKPYFIIHLDDTTGRTSGVYFSKKSTCDKVRALQVGDCIIARGNIGEYNGRRSFTLDKINKCEFPSDFVKKDKFKKSAPSRYSLIFPSAATTIRVNSVFDANEQLPLELTSKEYVVFDLETTGLELMSNGITEIGAVKIINGKITEQFTTLVKPDYPILPDNAAITGITPEMVKDSPRIGAVIPDFIKFIQGSILVAQNAEFDLKFIKRFAGAEDYEVKNKVLDTMEMSRALLPFLRHNNLKTLAEHFGIVFHHHRALSDAYATAEIFIELMKIKAEKESKKI